MKGQKACAVDSRPARHVQVGSVLISMKRHIQRWLELHRQRRLLAQMSDGALKDLGLSRATFNRKSNVRSGTTRSSVERAVGAARFA